MGTFTRSTWEAMLDDNSGGTLESSTAIDGGRGVEDVVVGEFLTAVTNRFSDRETVTVMIQELS